MSKRPVIGIAGILVPSPLDSPFHDIRRDITNEAYTKAVRLAGGTPILLPVPVGFQGDQEIDAYVQLCDGILFPGGEDINPSYYGQDRHPLLGETDDESDRFQLALFHAARKQGLPILGICRGCQLINVACEGTLFQDQSLREHEGIKLNHQHYKDAAFGCHQAFLAEDSSLSKLFPGPHLFVNSLHHQQINVVGNGLKTAALAEDGGIEAIEAIDSSSWVCGVQWHPEAMMMKNDMMLPLFFELVRQACKT